MNILLQVIHIKRRKFFQMVNVYMLPSIMHLSASHVLLLNQRILFIWSVIWVFVINLPSTLFLFKNLMMEQILNWFILLFTHIKEYGKNGIIPNEPTLWKICEANDDINNDLIKRPTYRNKKRLTNMSYYIGDFH